MNRPCSFILLCALVAMTVPARRAVACSPCLNQLDVRQTARRAALIVVARRADDSNVFQDGSMVERYEVIEVLKGAVRPHTIIPVASFMCDSTGSVEPGASQVMFLERGTTSYRGLGECTVGGLEIRDGMVTIERTDLSVPALAGALGLNKPVTAAEEAVSPVWWPLAPAGGAVVAVFAAYLLGRAHGRRSA